MYFRISKKHVIICKFLITLDLERKYLWLQKEFVMNQEAFCLRKYLPTLEFNVTERNKFFLKNLTLKLR